MNYTLRDYHAACLNSNRVFDQIRQGGSGFAELATALRSEKEIRAHLEDRAREGYFKIKDIEKIRLEFAPKTPKEFAAQGELTI